MAEYWYAKEEYEDRALAFKNAEFEPDITMDYSIKTKDFVTAGKASSDIKKTLKKLGIDPVILRRVAIASYEAEINIAAHSEGGRINCNIFDEMVHIEFIDNGPGMKDIEQAMVPGWSTADDLTREMGFGAGLGLPNIKKNSDGMRIRSVEGGSTHLEFIIFYK